MDVFYRFVACNAGYSVIVDGGGCINPYLIGEAGDELGLSRESVLQVPVSRAFTTYQISGIIDNLWSQDFRVVCFLEPFDLFRDEEIDEKESMGVLRNCLSELQKICIDKNAVSVMFSLNGIGCFSEVLSNFLDDVVEIQESKGCFEVYWRDMVRSFCPSLDRHQTTIDRYVEVEGVREFSFPFEAQRRLSHFIEVDVNYLGVELRGFFPWINC
ncbi:hypothetical protein [Methanonatronarchaeum sp. AMET-Sl]|uniref:hypothetical protein n=1 Tax=Methanonatronarchaeum sp. AMET-Sl TaxID=3037654 RepID=UPI00244E2D9C|nr:hypothetical protein [Methanonatronarchaeum sp. AMET-Sl]WGI17471.1 hypothetical protein QEN48_00250 [Methanonatronarchaeum sp. AMET-Sl]